jgi:transposase
MAGFGIFLGGYVRGMRYPDSGGLSAAGRAKREVVRMQAARMFAEGRTPAEVAERFRVSQRSAYNWRSAWSAGGSPALASRGHGGAQCQLDRAQQARLGAELDRGPLAHGYEDQRWTLARVAELIEGLFGYRYTLRGVSYLLHRLGFSLQAPVRRAVERDEQAIQRWQRSRWPAVKG